MDHKAGNQLPHGWMMGFSTVQVELFPNHIVMGICRDGFDYRNLVIIRQW